MRKLITCLSLLSLLSLLFLVGCGTRSVIVRPDGSMEAIGYDNVIVAPDKGTSLTYKPLLSFGVLDKAIDGFVKIVSPVTEVITPKPTPVPAPTPTPIPVPTPDPVPTPTPNPNPNPPIVKNIILFDLPQTAIELTKEGFPGYEGELLYCLGQVANGWAIPNDPGHPGLLAFATDPGLRKKLEDWYDKKIADIIKELNTNSLVNVTILDNDQVNRFGCRIGPATMGRLGGFGARVQMGNMIPESSY